MYSLLKYPISLTPLQQTFTLFPEFRFDLRGFQFGRVEEIQWRMLEQSHYMLGQAQRVPGG
jgi:hypothetical protein